MPASQTGNINKSKKIIGQLLDEINANGSKMSNASSANIELELKL